MKNESEGFNGLVGESGNAQRAGNAGTRPATHTGDSTPRPRVKKWRVEICVMEGGRIFLYAYDAIQFPFVSMFAGFPFIDIRTESGTVSHEADAIRAIGITPVMAGRVHPERR